MLLLTLLNAIFSPRIPVLWSSSQMQAFTHSHIILSIYLFYLAASGLSYSTRDLCSIMRDLLLWCTDSLDEAHKVSSCTTKASLPCCMWDLSSPTRDQTQVPCIARQILNHWVIREVPHIHILKLLSPIQNTNLFLLKYALISWPTASTLHVFHLKSFSSYLTSANRKAKPT